MATLAEVLGNALSLEACLASKHFASHDEPDPSTPSPHTTLPQYSLAENNGRE